MSSRLVGGLIAVLVALLRGTPLTAQEPAPATDSATAVAPSVGGHHWLLLPAMAAAGAVLALAPPAILLAPNLPDPVYPWDAPSHQVRFFVTGGLTGKKRLRQWTHSETVELHHQRIFGALQLEAFEAPRATHFQTLRLGYLVQPKPGMRGGVTLGYRRTSGSTIEDAAEVGLPLEMLAEQVGFRFVPSYLVSNRGVTWAYRLQMEVYIPRPLMYGVVIEAKPLYQGGPYRAMVSLMFGGRR